MTIQQSTAAWSIAGRKTLPVLPPGAPYLLRRLMNEALGFAELAAEIERFPSIAARLISVANSAWSAPVSAITSLDAACARLGLQVVRSVSIALAVSSPFDPNRCPAFDLERFWCTALLAADAASWLAERARSPLPLEPPTCRTGGLLHNLGLLGLAHWLPGETSRALGVPGGDSDSSLRQRLRDVCGTDYCEASGALGRRWDLPAPLVVAMAQHKTPDRRRVEWQYAALVGCAAGMVGSLFSDGVWEADARLCVDLALGVEDANGVFARVEGGFESTRELARTVFAV